ncbi:MAG: hypothetical protein R6U63_00670 [Longimicrobiales bacterium]
MRRRMEVGREQGRCRCCDMMREELCHALVEALYELDVLPENEEGALVGVYAVIDDLRTALDRTECLDMARSA